MNYKFLLKTLLFWLCSAVSVASIGAQAKSGKSHNQHQSGNGDINLFTGQVNFPVHLYKLRGRGGMDVSVDLSYGSNVSLGVRSRNDKNPTGVVGLGWNFGSGDVSCDHKSTYTYKDDRCFLINANGVRQEIFKKIDGSKISYYLEKDPFWKVEAILVGQLTSSVADDDIHVVAAWKFKDLNGKTFVYGNPNLVRDDLNTSEGQESSPVHYVFAWGHGSGGGFVGNGSHKNGARLYPFRWNLNSVSDAFGNTTLYKWSQVQEAIWHKNKSHNFDFKSDSPSSISGSSHGILKYTKANYLSEIHTSEGHYVKFEYEEKDSYEYLDQNGFNDREPDADMEIFETKYLNKVLFFQKELSALDAYTRVREFQLCYSFFNLSKKTDYYLKRTISEISELDINGDVVGSHTFAYFNDEAFFEVKENEQAKVENYGALKTYTNPLGGRVEYGYTKASFKGKETPSFLEEFKADFGIEPLSKEVAVIADVVAQQTLGVPVAQTIQLLIATFNERFGRKYIVWSSITEDGQKYFMVTKNRESCLQTYVDVNGAWKKVGCPSKVNYDNGIFYSAEGMLVESSKNTWDEYSNDIVDKSVMINRMEQFTVHRLDRRGWKTIDSYKLPAFLTHFVIENGKIFHTNKPTTAVEVFAKSIDFLIQDVMFSVVDCSSGECRVTPIENDQGSIPGLSELSTKSILGYLNVDSPETMLLGSQSILLKGVVGGSVLDSDFTSKYSAIGIIPFGDQVEHSLMFGGSFFGIMADNREAIGDNYFDKIFKTSSLKIFRFDGSKYKLEENSIALEGDSYGNFVLGDGYFARLTANSQFYYTHTEILGWNGVGWTSEKKVRDSWSPSIDPDFQGMGSNYLVVRHDRRKFVKVFHWDGDSWNVDVDKQLLNIPLHGGFGESNWAGVSGSDYFIGRYPFAKFRWKTLVKARRFRVPYCCWKNTPAVKIPWYDFKSYAQGYVWKWDMGEVYGHDFGSFGRKLTSKRYMTLEDAFVVKSGDWNETYFWNGESWVEEKRKPFVSEDLHMVDQNSFIERVVSDESIGPLKKGSLKKINLHHSYLNSTTRGGFSYLVTSKQVEDEPTDKKSKVNYGYDVTNATFDFSSGQPSFSMAWVDNDIGGRTYYYYHNGYQKDSKGNLVIEDRFIGSMYRSEHWTIKEGKNQSLVSWNETEFEWIYGEFPEFPLSEAVRPISQKSMNKGIVAKSEFEYDDFGALRYTWSDTKNGVLLRELKYAHTYAESDPNNECNLCQSLADDGRMRAVVREDFYKNASFGSKNAAQNNNRLTSLFTDWSQSWDKLTWVPKSTFSWVGGNNNASHFVEGSSLWRRAGFITKINEIGNITESELNTGIVASKVYDDYSGMLKLASVVGASQEEYLYLSGNNVGGWSLSSYTRTADLDEGAYESWFTKAITLGFGSAATLAKNVNTVDENYKVVAWILPLSTESTAKTTVTAGLGSSSKSVVLDGGLKWQKIVLHLSNTTSGSKSFSFSSNKAIKILEVRVFPISALLTSQHFDPQTYNVVADLDAEGSFRSYEYDGQGRVTKQYTENTIGEKVLLNESKYFFGAGKGDLESGKLASLNVSKGHLPFSESKTSYVVPISNSVSSVTISFTPKEGGDRFKRAVVVGTNGSKTYEFDCCSSRESMVVPLPKSAATVKVYLQSAYATHKPEYVIDFQKPQVGWLVDGTVSTVNRRAKRPILGGGNSSLDIAYVGELDGQLHVKKKGSTAARATLWENGVPLNAALSNIDVGSLKRSGDLMAYHDLVYHDFGTATDVDDADVNRLFVMQNTSGTWSKLGDAITDNEVIDFSISKMGNSPIIAYIANSKSEYRACVAEGVCANTDVSNLNELGSAVFLKKWNESIQKWERFGALPTDESHLIQIPGRLTSTLENTLIKEGEVWQDGNVSEVELAVLGNDICATMVTGVAVEADSESEVPPPLFVPVTICLNGQTGALQETGEFLPIPGVEQMQIARDGTNMYLALKHPPFSVDNSTGDVQEKEGKSISVWKWNTTRTNSITLGLESHWSLLSNEIESFGQFDKGEVFRLGQRGEFALNLREAQLNLAFSGMQNDHDATVIQYDFASQKWASVGNPAFYDLPRHKLKNALSVAKIHGKSRIAFVDRDGEKNKPGVMVFEKQNENGRNHNLTLFDQSGLQNENLSTELNKDWNFRGYLTNFTSIYKAIGTYRSATDFLKLNLNPKVLADVSAITVYLNGKMAFDEITQKKVVITNVSNAISEIPQQTLQAANAIRLKLRKGENKIEVRVVGKNKQVLQYQWLVDNQIPAPNPKGLSISVKGKLSNPKNNSDKTSSIWSTIDWNWDWDEIFGTQDGLGCDSSFSGSVKIPEDLETLSLCFSSLENYKIYNPSNNQWLYGEGCLYADVIDEKISLQLFEPGSLESCDIEVDVTRVTQQSILEEKNDDLIQLTEIFDNKEQNITSVSFDSESNISWDIGCQDQFFGVRFSEKAFKISNRITLDGVVITESDNPVFLKAPSKSQEYWISFSKNDGSEQNVFLTVSRREGCFGVGLDDMRWGLIRKHTGTSVDGDSHNPGGVTAIGGRKRHTATSPSSTEHHYETLTKFDVSHLNENEVQSVSLRIHIPEDNPGYSGNLSHEGDQNIDIWDVGNITWDPNTVSYHTFCLDPLPENHYYCYDYEQKVASQIVSSKRPGWVTVASTPELVALVKKWIQSPETNRGIVLNGEFHHWGWFINVDKVELVVE